MSKIIITPDVVSDYISLKEKPVVTFHQTGIVFNKSAKVGLALKKDGAFNLQLEDGKLFYSDATSGFKLNESGRGKVVASQCKGILNFFIEKLSLKNNPKQLRFEIGEFTEGRRELKLLVG